MTEQIRNNDPFWLDVRLTEATDGISNILKECWRHGKTISDISTNDSDVLCKKLGDAADNIMNIAKLFNIPLSKIIKNYERTDS